jgi:hypothetical protein
MCALHRCMLAAPRESYPSRVCCWSLRSFGPPGAPYARSWSGPRHCTSWPGRRCTVTARLTRLVGTSPPYRRTCSARERSGSSPTRYTVYGQKRKQQNIRTWTKMERRSYSQRVDATHCLQFNSAHESVAAVLSGSAAVVSMMSYSEVPAGFSCSSSVLSS